MDLLTVLQAIGAPKLRDDARRYVRAARERAAIESGPPAPRSGRSAATEVSVGIGVDRRGRDVRVPLSRLYGHGLILGASGAGKSYTAAALMTNILEAKARGFNGSFALVDMKGELFDLLSAKPSNVPIIRANFAGSSPVPYALLKPRCGESAEGLVDRRMEIFDDVLGRDSQLSLRMSRMLRNFLMLAIEHELAFPLLEFLFASPDVTETIALSSRHERVKMYFTSDFARERNTTLPALSARLDFILRHEHLRLSFGADDFIDLKAAMDEGTPVLITAGGPTLPRSLSRIIQSIVVSDLRQAVFARKNHKRPYLWFIDEAQVLFSQRADADNVSTLLAMSRSFGASLALITQSLTAACPDRDLLASLETNVRWMVVFRCGLQDAQILEPALPVTGQLVRQRYERGRIGYMTPAQELTHRLRQVTNLPPRTGFFWLRGAGMPATLITTHSVRSGQKPSATPSAGQQVSADSIRKRLAEQEAQLRRMTFKPATPADRKRSKGSAKVHDILGRLEQKFREQDGE